MTKKITTKTAKHGNLNALEPGPHSTTPSPIRWIHTHCSGVYVCVCVSLMFQAPPVCSQHSALCSCVGLERLMEERCRCFLSSSMLPLTWNETVTKADPSGNVCTLSAVALSPFYHCCLWDCDRHWMFGINSWVNIGITLETAEGWPYWCVPPFWALNPHAWWDILKALKSPYSTEVLWNTRPQIYFPCMERDCWNSFLLSCLSYICCSLFWRLVSKTLVTLFTLPLTFSTNFVINFAVTGFVQWEVQNDPNVSF